MGKFVLNTKMPAMQLNNYSKITQAAGEGNQSQGGNENTVSSIQTNSQFQDQDSCSITSMPIKFIIFMSYLYFYLFFGRK